MNKRIAEILNYLSLEKIKNDRRIVVFSVCLLIATGLWFLNALSKNYSTSVFFPVKYINPPEDYFLISAPPEKFELKVRAHGFTLLRHKMTLSAGPVVINLNSLRQNSNEQRSTTVIPAERLNRIISGQISNEFTILDISPQTLTLDFDRLASKKVPVKASVQTSFQPQFNLSGEIVLEPESLTVKGPASVLDTVQILKTQYTRIKEIDSDIEMEVPVIAPPNTKLGKKTVILKLPVEKFTEKNIVVPLQVKNSPPESKVRLFPSEVEVTVMVGLSHYEEINAADFQIFVDFKQANAGTETLKVAIEEKPPFIQMLRISPQTVEFLIETD